MTIGKSLAKLVLKLPFRDLKYSHKILYFTKNYPSLAGFSILWIFVWANGKHCSMSENNITKVNSICLWLNISSPNLHKMFVHQYTHFDVLIYQMLLQVMESLIDFISFNWVFSFLSVLLYLHQTFSDCVPN